MSTTSNSDDNSGVGCLIIIGIALIVWGGAYLIGAWALLIGGFALIALAIWASK